MQLYLLSRVLESGGPATHAVVELVRWFTLGQPGWHTLPERAQREAVVSMEHFLLLHLPQLATLEGRSTPTGPLPLLTARQMQEGGPGDPIRRDCSTRRPSYSWRGRCWPSWSRSTWERRVWCGTRSTASRDDCSSSTGSWRQR